MDNPNLCSSSMDSHCVRATASVCATSACLALHAEICESYLDSLSFCCASCARFARMSRRGTLSCAFSSCTSRSTSPFSRSRLVVSSHLSPRTFSHSSIPTRVFTDAASMASVACATATWAASVCLSRTTPASRRAVSSHSWQVLSASRHAGSAASTSCLVWSMLDFKRWLWKRRASFWTYQLQKSALARCNSCKALFRVARFLSPSLKFAFF
mmetsp:Transcript_89134/g.260573  ORF Transcript_89134/g.260573 Transcript_89134/m.260573 type:complete len:213 (-) Transcript_89134:846-1484(-)